jgi:hypothetical protein
VVLFALIGVRLHGWLDDVVVLVYLAGTIVFGLYGAAALIALAGASVHFVLTRLTDYAQGSWRLLPFRGHAFVELAEGVGVLAASLALTTSHPPAARVFLTAMGAAQLGAFAFSDYGARPARNVTSS